MRVALVDNFRNDSTIMIATEAAAEGINLQFCSMLINFDMPWNPQRIEQRIEGATDMDRNTMWLSLIF